MSKDVASMVVRVEVAKRLKNAYRSTSKAEKSAVLDHFCQATGPRRSTTRTHHPILSDRLSKQQYAPQQRNSFSAGFACEIEPVRVGSQDSACCHELLVCFGGLCEVGLLQRFGMWTGDEVLN